MKQAKVKRHKTAKIAFIIGIAFSIMFFAMGGYDHNKLNNEIAKVRVAQGLYAHNEQIRFSIGQNLREVNISADHRVYISTSMDTNAAVNISGEPMVILEEEFSNQINSSYEQGVLTVTTNRFKNRWFGVNFTWITMWESPSIYIHIPKNYNLDALNINVSSGSVYLDDLIINSNLNVSTSSGSVKVNNVNADNININAKSGSIRVDTASTQNLEIAASSGSVGLYNINASNLTVNSKSGSVRVENANIAGNATINASSGAIRLTEVNAAKLGIKANSGSIRVYGGIQGEIDAEADSGTIRLNLVGSYHEFSFDLLANSGSVRLNGTRKGNYFAESGGDRLVKARASSGSIRVNI